MLAFRRFTALRGPCYHLKSDQGSNFIGARNQAENTIDEKVVRCDLESRGCKWELIPPRASHMAGIWERKIASVKKVLHTTLFLLKSRCPHRDEFITFLCEAAAIVNSTPLNDILSNPNEPFPVCPAMLLTLRTTPPSLGDYNETDLCAYGRKRWRRVQYIADQFWHLWKNEYILEQQSRRKWLTPKPNVDVGDVVLIKDISPRYDWPLAVVTKVCNSGDGLVRRVMLRLKRDSFGKPQFRKRAIHDLVILLKANSAPGECPGRALP